MTFFDCTADLVGQLSGNGQKGMLQTDAPPVDNFWLRHCIAHELYLPPVRVTDFGSGFEIIVVPGTPEVSESGLRISVNSCRLV